jgi:hypothetical protein
MSPTVGGQRYFTVKGLGFELPVTRGAVAWLSVLCVIGLSAAIYRQIFPVPPITPQQVNDILEYQTHIGETPETVFADPDGALSLRVYRDHAVLIVRKDGSRAWTRLVPDLAKTPSAVNRGMWEFVGGVVEARADECQPRHAHREVPQRSEGPREGCLVRMFWTYPDGCQFYVLYDACRQAFESNPDGSPRNHWVRCLP